MAIGEIQVENGNWRDTSRKMAIGEIRKTVQSDSSGVLGKKSRKIETLGE